MERHVRLLNEARHGRGCRRCRFREPRGANVFLGPLPRELVSDTQSPTVLRLYKSIFFFFYRKHELILSSTGGKQTARGSESLIKN